MVPVPLPVLQIDLGKLGVIPVHQNVFPVTFLSSLGVIEAPLLHRTPVYDDDLVVRNGVLGINSSRDAGIRDKRSGRVFRTPLTLVDNYLHVHAALVRAHEGFGDWR